MGWPYIPKRFLGAFKAGHRASAREFIDEELAYKLLKRVLDSDYSDREALKALDYLTKFNNEYHKAVIKKGDRRALHNTKKMRQERYGANNARNRDIMSVERRSILSLTPRPVDTGVCLQLEKDTFAQIPDNINHETTIIDLIDSKNKLFD